MKRLLPIWGVCLLVLIGVLISTTSRDLVSAETPEDRKMAEFAQQMDFMKDMLRNAEDPELREMIKEQLDRLWDDLDEYQRTRKRHCVPNNPTKRVEAFAESMNYRSENIEKLVKDVKVSPISPPSTLRQGMNALWDIYKMTKPFKEAEDRQRKFERSIKCPNPPEATAEMGPFVGPFGPGSSNSQPS